MNTPEPKRNLRPLPRFPEPDSQPFWEATRQHKLLYQVCRSCAGVVFYPRSHCTHCTSLDLAWQESKGQGAIYTYTTIRRSQHPGFKDLVPYVLAWVDLDEKFRLLTHIVGVADPSREVRIGQRVRVEWLDYESVCLPAFRLA